MSYFAKLDTNNVVVLVVRGRDEDDGKENELSERTGEIYKQTSYNTHGGIHALGGVPFRKNFAGVGFRFDVERDAFIAPQPFNSWSLDEESCVWIPPVAKPDDGKFYSWNEETQEWVEL